MNVKIKIKTKTYNNPIWVASGTFGYGEEFQDFLDLNEVGAIVTKTVPLEPRVGNPPPRVVETPSGMLNSIGLENKGVDHFIKEYLPVLRKFKTRVVVSISGSKKNEFVKCAEKLSGKNEPDAIELNLSCPNVTHRQTRYSLIAQDPRATKEIVAAVRKVTRCAIIAKLSPNVTDIAVIAGEAENAGADAIALVNTYQAMAVDAEEMKPVLGNVVGGLSGPAIKPMALKMVRDVYNNINIPVIGIGGIMTGTDVAEFMLCGARAVQIGTANLADPAAYKRILDEFKAYLAAKGIKRASDLVGALRG